MKPVKPVGELSAVQDALAKIEALQTQWNGMNGIGESPEARRVRAQYDNAVGFLRDIVSNPPAWSSKRSEGKPSQGSGAEPDIVLDPSLPVGGLGIPESWIRSQCDLFKLNPPRIPAADLDMERAVSDRVKDLPPTMLHKLHAEVIPHLPEIGGQPAFDGQPVAGSLTVADIRKQIEVIELAKRLELERTMPATARAMMQEIELALSPWDERLPKVFALLRQPVLYGDPTAFVERLRFALQKALRKLEVETDRPAPEEPNPTPPKPTMPTATRGNGRGQQIGAKTTGNKGGRKPQYDADFCRLVQRTYEEHFANGIGSKGAWYNAAVTHGLLSGDAARMLCRRHLQPPKTEQ
jgi:hypothetical protein